jgi:tetratricopeptide (TPR) repeat protein
MSRLLMLCALILALACLAQAEPEAVKEPAAPAPAVVDPAAAPAPTVAEPATVPADPAVDPATVPEDPVVNPPAPFTAQDARAAVQDAVALLVKVNQQLADDYFHTGEWDKSIAVLDRIIQLTPDELNAYANAAWLLWSTDKSDQAMVYYQRLIANNPTNPDAYYIVGQYYFLNRKDYAAALPYLQKAVDLGGGMMQRHLHAHCLAKLGRTDDAVAAWRKIQADDPKDEVAPKEIDKLLKGEPAKTNPPATGAVPVPAP